MLREQEKLSKKAERVIIDEGKVALKAQKQKLKEDAASVGSGGTISEVSSVLTADVLGTKKQIELEAQEQEQKAKSVVDWAKKSTGGDVPEVDDSFSGSGGSGG